jgi:hypothetical protein
MLTRNPHRLNAAPLSAVVLLVSHPPFLINCDPSCWIDPEFLSYCLLFNNRGNNAGTSTIYNELE